jgi:MHS family shikimate/dehydroshikimate transporter-like MFS transporter
MDIKTRVNLSSAMGATFAWYDFAIFNIAVALIFPQLFFTGMGFLIPVLVFAVGTVARPLGSLVFGYIGDRLGRKTALISTLYLTGITTVAIGLMPTYQDVGVIATVLLITARLIQTVAVGGEWAAASTMMLEYNVESSRKGFISSFITSGFALAHILASLVFMIVTQFGDEFFATVGWRIPFLLSAFMLLIGVYVRRKILETPEFEQMKSQGTIQKNPVTALFRDHLRPMVVGALSVSLGPAWFYTLITAGSAYVLSAGLLTRGDLTQQQFAAWWVILGIMLLCGWLIDKVKPYHMFVATSVFSVILALPVIGWLQQGQILWAMIGTGVIMTPALMTAPYLFCKMYPAPVRQTGSGWTYGIGLALSGLFTVLAQKVVGTTGDIYSLIYVFGVLTVVTLITGGIYLRKYSQES